MLLMLHSWQLHRFEMFTGCQPNASVRSPVKCLCASLPALALHYRDARQLRPKPIRRAKQRQPTVPNVTLALFGPQTAGEGFAAFKVAAQIGLLTVYTASILKSASALLTASTSKSPVRDTEEEESVGVQWGVMALISVLPLFNWLVSPELRPGRQRDLHKVS